MPEKRQARANGDDELASKIASGRGAVATGVIAVKAKANQM
jgi:hypothetical protein